MARLRTEEVRRLMIYLSQQIRDPKRLAEIEDALRDEYAEEFLREPDLLVYFPEHTAEIFASGANWRLRIIPTLCCEWCSAVSHGTLLKTYFCVSLSLVQPARTL